MPPEQVEAFKRAAHQFKVWILVRRGNKNALRWVGRLGYIPKPADCKAKTADADYKQYAGLVTRPVLVPAAFSPHRLGQAQEIWRDFEREKIYIFNPDDLGANLAADKAGKHYTVQMNRQHEHYGCVIYKPVYRSQAEYIYSDYDIYAIVPEDRPQDNVFSFRKDEKTQKITDAQGKMLLDLQYFVKAAGEMRNAPDSRPPMIRHGEQETFKTDYSDPLDVFWPDGMRISALEAGQPIKDFYERTLHGRRQVDENTVRRLIYGNWWRT
jgi:hypothetical protein